MLPSKDLGLNSQSLCTPCIRCHASQRDDTRQLTDLHEVTARIEGEGHGPLLPPSKDGRLPNQNLLQSVTPKTVTDRKEDKQGTPLVKGHSDISEAAFGSRRKRAGCAWCAPRTRSRGLTPTRLMKKQSRDKTTISQASSARRESIYAENPGVTHDNLTGATSLIGSTVCSCNARAPVPLLLVLERRHEGGDN